MGNRASEQVRGTKGLENREAQGSTGKTGRTGRTKTTKEAIAGSGENFGLTAQGPWPCKGYSVLRTKNDGKGSESARVVLALEGHWRGTRP